LVRVCQALASSWAPTAMKRPARVQPAKAIKAKKTAKSAARRLAAAVKEQRRIKERSCRDDGAFKGSVNLWLVRHGETENNVMLRNMREEFSDLPKVELTKRYNLVRGDDPGLSPLGLSQCLALPTHPALVGLLKSGRPVDIYSSPLRRAIETAAPLQKALAAATPIRLIPELCEIGGLRTPTANGDQLLPGKKPAELQASFPDLSIDTSHVPAAGWWVGASKEYTTEVRGARLLGSVQRAWAGWYESFGQAWSFRTRTQVTSSLSVMGRCSTTWSLNSLALHGSTSR